MGKILSFVHKNYKAVLLFSIVLVLGFALLSYKNNLERRANEAEERATELSIRLASSEKTIELKDQLYSRRTAELLSIKSSLTVLLSQAEIDKQQINDLKEQLEKTKAEVIAANVLVVKWKKAYEGALNASQTDEPDPEDPTIVRKRVDFTADFGYIGVSGHTLTDPAEGFVSVKQLRPLRLALVITKAKNGDHVTYVTTSEDGVEVDLSVSGLDTSVVIPKKKRRENILLSFEFDVLGTNKSFGSDISYDFDKLSVGTGCSVHEGFGWSCGFKVGFRPFK